MENENESIGVLVGMDWPNFYSILAFDDAFDFFHNVFIHYFNINFITRCVTVSNGSSGII